MKSRSMLFVVLMALSTLALAQSDAQKSPTAPVPSAAQKSFATMKSLAGSWEGHVTTVPPAADIEGKLMQVSLRVTSMGHTLMHEVTGTGRPDDPITMFVVDGDRLLLTHYCDADNRPRMVGTMSPDGKTVEFEFLDISGNCGTDTCSMRCSPSSTRTITPRTGRSCSRATSRCTRTSTCSAQNDRSVSLIRLSGKPDGP